MKNTISFILITLALTACISYGENTQSDFAPLKTVDCDIKSDVFYVFMEGEEVPFEYERLGMVEAQGGQFASLSEVMDELKYKAWQNCANGIINVSQASTVRESGVAFVDDTEDLYASKVMTGVAIRIEETEEFIASYENHRSDDAFISSVEKRKAKETKRTGTEVTMNIIVAVVGLIALMVAL
ncbi:MAG: hypothetical protein Tsb0034_28500 [Ekhidna sp.]